MKGRLRTGRSPYNRQIARQIRHEPYEDVEAFVSLGQAEDYCYSTVTPKRCVWDGTCETCPSSYLCNS